MQLLHEVLSNDGISISCENVSWRWPEELTFGRPAEEEHIHEPSILRSEMMFVPWCICEAKTVGDFRGISNRGDEVVRS